MRIFLLQHGLKDRHTYFYGETLGWIDALNRRQRDFKIYVHAEAEPDIVQECGATPLFSFAPGARTIADPVTDQIDSFLRYSRLFARDCAVLSDAVNATDILIVAFATERELFGAAQWLATIPEARRPHLVFHFVTPDFRWAVNEDRSAIKGDVGYYRFAANQLSEVSDRFHLFAGTDRLCRALQGAFDRPVSLAPLPMAYPASVDLPAHPDDPAWEPTPVGFVGEYRQEKGGAVLPDVIARFRAARPDRRFFLQVQNATQAAAVSERIGHLDGLDIHTGQLSHRAYVSRLETLEILLLPYMPGRYALRSSGIFAEAVAHGLVTVVPDKTWMADQLAAGRGAGVTFKDHTAESIAAALVAANDTRAVLQAEAATRRDAWRAAECVDAFFDRIIERVETA